MCKGGKTGHESKLQAAYSRQQEYSHCLDDVGRPCAWFLYKENFSIKGCSKAIRSSHVLGHKAEVIFP